MNSVNKSLSDCSQTLLSHYDASFSVILLSTFLFSSVLDQSSTNALKTRIGGVKLQLDHSWTQRYTAFNVRGNLSAA
jgi:hypothetical protein